MIQFFFIISTFFNYGMFADIIVNNFIRIPRCFIDTVGMDFSTAHRIRSKLECAQRCFHDNECMAFIYKNPQCLLKEQTVAAVCHTVQEITPAATYYEKVCKNGGYFLNGQCVCIKGFIGTRCENVIRDCEDGASYYPDGTFDVFMVQPPNALKPFKVRCFMTLENRLYIAQNNPTGISFKQNWEAYRTGFFSGDDSSFYIGNANIRALTSSYTFSLYIQFVMDADYASLSIMRFDEFSISGESDNFRMTYTSGTLDTTKNMETIHNCMSTQKGSAFSTYDIDNDQYAGNCADKFGTGWWFKDCSQCNPLGKLFIQGNNHRLGLDTEFLWQCGLQGKTPYFVDMWLQRV